ncbi:MAG: hypothetical protein A2Y33_01305 [Spirochaetes bacterium GWF1_51_8]|nr:MAG: hypothetical protein A2Y33_01305 [Spirochaetes bacterium GWF1_51_8]
MKRNAILLFFLITVSCGGVSAPSVKPGVVPSDKAMFEQKAVAFEKMLKDNPGFVSANPLLTDYQYFRLNQKNYNKFSYVSKNAEYMAALSNEFSVTSVDKAKSITLALSNYLKLAGKDKAGKPYLLQRAGICLYKLGKFQQANKYLNQAVTDGKADAEARYYLTLLYANYLKEFDKALAYASKIDASMLFVNKTEIVCLKATIYEKMGDANKAAEMYELAWKSDPEWFYTRYDLAPFYFSRKEPQKAGVFAKAAFEYLVSLNDDFYKAKAYSQAAYYNKLMGEATLEFSFGLPDGYDPANDIHYYCENASYLIERIESAGLKIPLKETKAGSAKSIFWATKERYIDFGGDSGMLLTMGNVIITNIRWDDEFLNFFLFPKRFFMSPVALLITPTNSLYFKTNPDKMPGEKGHIVTNISNQIFLLDLPFEYYLDDMLFDVDNDKNWDIVYFGFNRTNEIMMTVFYPALKKHETFQLPVTLHDAKVVIQDVDHDGVNDIFLLDKKAVFLKPKALP